MKGYCLSLRDWIKLKWEAYLIQVYKNPLKLLHSENSFYLLEGSELLNDYDLTKAHETENVDGTEGPANEEEDIGGEP